MDILKISDTSITTNSRLPTPFILSIYIYIILLGNLQGIVLALFLVAGERWQRLSNRFLALFLLSFVGTSCFALTESFGWRGQGQITIWDTVPLLWYMAMIASFYCFVKYLVRPKLPFQRRDLWWFAPFGIHLFHQFYHLILFHFFPNYFFKNLRTWFTINDVIDLLGVGLALVGIIQTLRLIRRYEQDLLNHYADISERSIKWLRNLIYLLIGIWVLWLIPTLFEHQSSIITGADIFYPMWIGLSIIVYWIGYATYARREWFDEAMFIEQETVTPIPSKTLSDKTEVYYQQLLEIMQTEELYLDADLNLKKLAERLELSNGYLSQIINQKEDKNFFDFINSYRIKDFKKKVADPKFAHLNLLGIAYEAGFKSKSTFNLAFKKLTGTTPSAYKKALK